MPRRDRQVSSWPFLPTASIGSPEPPLTPPCSSRYRLIAACRSHNRKPKPFVWTADPDRIIENLGAIRPVPGLPGRGCGAAIHADDFGHLSTALPKSNPELERLARLQRVDAYACESARVKE